MDGTGTYATEAACNLAENKCLQTDQCADDTVCNNGTCDTTTSYCNCAHVDTAADYVDWVGPFCDTIANTQSCPPGRFQETTQETSKYPRRFKCKQCAGGAPGMVQSVKCSGNGTTDTNKFVPESFLCGTSNLCANANGITEDMAESLGLDKDLEDLYKNCGAITEVNTGAKYSGYAYAPPKMYEQTWPWSNQYITTCKHATSPILSP
jgi:hypothetical protein